MSDNLILILKSSPRANGNSSILADQAGSGAREAGARVEAFNLSEMAIQPCNSCEGCHSPTGEGTCLIDDDMQKLYPLLRQAHSILLASPIYWFNYTAQLKLCVDRWYALETSRGNELKGKRFGIIFTYGDSDPYTSGAINAIRSFQDAFRYIHAEIAGMVYGSASNPGDVLQQKDLMERAFKLGQQLVN